MSKRFGRNQKRRMREEIAKQENLYQTTFNLMKVHRDKAAENGRRVMELEDEIQDAKDVLGAEFIGFRASDDLVEFINTSSHPIMRDLARRRRFTAVNYSMGDIAETIKVIPLDVLATTIDQDVYSAMQHIRLKVNGTSAVAYGLSQLELMRAPRHVLIKRVAEEIARLLTNQLKEIKA